MRPSDIERWALREVDRAARNEPVEDSIVELKAVWPTDHWKAARRIAGHANAAHSQPILWLIGVDEKNGVIGADHTEVASWHSAVSTYFDQVTPRMYDVNVPTNQGPTVTALVFETNRAPFVVRNKHFGQMDAGPIEREVPWREGTSIRSATRADLLLILSDTGLLSAALRELRWNLEVAKRQGFSQEQFRTIELEKLFSSQVMDTLDATMQTNLTDAYRAVSHAQSLVRSLENADVRSRIDVGNESIRARAEARPLIERTLRDLQDRVA